MDDNNLKLGRVMIVDDEAELMTALCEMIAAQGYETTGFTNGADALKVLVEQDYDLLLTDLMMPEMDGIALFQAGLEIDPNIVCIIMTGHGTVQTAVEAMKKGAFDYILKPFKLNTLMPALSRAMEVRSLRMDNIQLKETVAIHELGKAIAFSSDLNAIMNKVADAVLQQCASDEVSIMLPTRDGKELYIAVARGVHTQYIGERVPMNRGIAGWVASNRETLVINGKADDPRFSPVNPRSDIRAAVSMPMMAGGKLVGVLNVNVTKSHRQITIGQVKALSILVSIISPILENTWLNIKIREAENKYRTIFENSIEGIFQSTPEGKFITANMAMARMLGYDSPEELISEVTDIGRQLYVNPDERKKIFKVIKEEGRVKAFETRFYRKEGLIMWVSINMHAVYDKDGNILYYEGIEEDISERKIAESRQLLTARIFEILNRPNEIVNLIRDILLLLKKHADIEATGIRLREGDDFPYYVTNGFSDSFLKTENSLFERDATGEVICDTDGNPCLAGRCGNVLSGKIDTTLPYFTMGGSFWTNRTTEHPAKEFENDFQGCLRNRCNSEGYESVALIPLQAEDQIIGLLQLSDSRRDLFSLERIQFFERIGTAIGIAVVRKRSGEALRESEELFRSFLEDAPDGVYMSDLEGNFLYGNRKCEKILGYRREELIGKSFLELNILSENSLNKAAQLLQANMEGKSTGPDEIDLISKEGRLIPVEINTSVVQRMGQKIVLAFVRDITERKQAEEWLLRERSMVDRIMKTSPAGITVINRSGKIVFANKRAEEILGLTADKIKGFIYDDPKWQITDFDGNPFPDEKLPFMQVVSLGNPVYGIRHAITLPDGKRTFLSINGAPIFDDQGIVTEMVLIINDITQHRHDEEKITKGIEQLRESFEGTVKAMAMMVEARDPYTAGHQRRVSDLAQAIAIEMGLADDQVTGVRVGSITHDIGKISIPADILVKPGKLSDIEFSLIKTHPQSGYNILKDISFPWPITRMILEHHERMNGSGYPNGLTGENILLESRILSVADVVEAMGSHRPYRPTLKLDAAFEEIEKNKGILYDSDVVDACLRLFNEKGYKLAS